MPSAVFFTRANKLEFSLMLVGWGSFNLVEGLVDHHVLDLHHVRDLPAHVPAYDWTFLLLGGIALVVVGWLLSRGGYERRPSAAR